MTATDFSEVIEAARLNGEPTEVYPGSVYVVTTANGDVRTLDLRGDEYLDAPRRKKGLTVVRDAESFLAYWRKHHDANSEVYADRENGRITAVLDAHAGAGEAGRFGIHRVVLEVQHSPEFAAWSKNDGRQMSQVQFAEWVEDHRPDIRVPTAAELLELATTFQATTKATFRSATVLQSGQRALEYTEDMTASAGKGKLTIPDSFKLALPIYEGATVADEITARLRYRITNGQLAMYYILDQVDQVVRTAFHGVVEAVAEGLGEGVPILRGTPA